MHFTLEEVNIYKLFDTKYVIWYGMTNQCFFFIMVIDYEIRRSRDTLPNVTWMGGQWSPLSLEAFWQTPCGPLAVDRPLPLPVGWEGLLMVCVLLLVLHLARTAVDCGFSSEWEELFVHSFQCSFRNGRVQPLCKKGKQACYFQKLERLLFVAFLGGSGF